MTCIIALIKDGIGYMAGDRCASQGTSEKLVINKKVFNKRGVLVGVCGSFRLINIIEQMEIRPVIAASRTLEDFCFNFCNHLINNLDNNKALSSDENTASMPGDSEVVVVYRNNIIHIGSDFGYTILDGSILSIGVPEHAEGFLQNVKSSDVHKTIKKCMKYVSKNNSNVSEEFDFVTNRY